MKTKITFLLLFVSFLFFGQRKRTDLNNLINKYQFTSKQKRNTVALEQKLDSVLIKLYISSTSTFYNMEKKVFVYDNNGNNTETYNYELQNNNWTPNSKKIYTFDAQNKLIDVIKSHWNDNINDWKLYEKEEFTYNNDLVSEILKSNWDNVNQSWEINSKSTYTYNSNDILTEIYLYNYLNQWIFDKRLNYTFDANGKITEVFIYEWDDNFNTWDSWKKKSYLYNTNNQLIETIEYDWDNAQWLEEINNIYTYNTQGALEEKIMLMFDGSNWVNEYKTEMLNYNYTFSFEQLALPNDYTDFFNLNDDSLLFIYMPINGNFYVWDDNINDWGNDYLYLDFYFSPLNTGSIDKNDTLNFIVFPNPVDETLHISTNSAEGFKATVYDISGNIVKTIATNDNTTSVDVSNWAKGIYFVKIQSDKGIHTHKIIVK
jgi:hypothetical protein